MNSLDRDFREKLSKVPIPWDYINNPLRQQKQATILKKYKGKLDDKYFRSLFNLFAYAPHPVQWSYHNGDQFLRAFYGGERSGKTIAGIAEVCWVATGTHPYLDRFNGVEYLPSKIRSITPDLRRFFWGIQWPYYKMFLGDVGGPIIKSFSREQMVMELRSPWNSTIEFMSYEQDLNKFGGVKLDFVHFDEEPPSQSLWGENLKRLLDREGRAIMTFTPQKERGYTWSFDLVRDRAGMKDKRVVKKLLAQGFSEKDAIDQAPPLIGVWDCPTELNPYISHSTKSKVEQLTGHEFTGDYVVKSAMIFPQFGEHNLKDHLPENVFWNELMIIVGIDHQEGRNPEGIVICGVDRYNRVWVLDEIYYAADVESYANSLNAKLAGVKPKYIVIDHNACIKSSISGKSAKDVYGQHGVFCQPAMKGPGSFDPGLQMMRKMFKGPEPRLYVMRRCSNLIRQLRRYIWDEYLTRIRERKSPKEKPVTKDDHLIDALRYVLTFAHGPRYSPPEMNRDILPQPSKDRAPIFKKTGY